MVLRGGACEACPLQCPPMGAKAHALRYAGDSVSALAPREEDFLGSGLALAKVGPGLVRTWAALQAIGLTFHFFLWREVAAQLAEWEATLARECAKEKLERGVCSGPMWRLAAWEELEIPGQSWFNPEIEVVQPDLGWSNSRSLKFTAESAPPTFLVVVDPREDTPWRLDVRRLKPPSKEVGAMTWHRAGRQALSVEDLSTRIPGSEWLATITSASKKTEHFLAFVEDARMPHLADIHASPQCTFARSWKAFTEQTAGSQQRALSWCRGVLGFFLASGTAAVALVLLCDERHALFRLVVLAKFILQDVPVQVCMVLYLFGWYGSSGWRCQLCLFQPQHCGDEEPFSALNLAALAGAVGSAMSPQALIRPLRRKPFTEEQIFLQLLMRVGGTCVAVLPFTTAACMMYGNNASWPHMLLALPCALGWVLLPCGVGCLSFRAMA